MFYIKYYESLGFVILSRAPYKLNSFQLADKKGSNVQSSCDKKSRYFSGFLRA
jgi:hypothetical protein